MRKIYSIAIALFITASVWAQSPQKMSYQAVVRNSTNQLVTNQKVGMQITILQGSATGTEVYTETQAPTTNANGLVSIEIGVALVSVLSIGAPAAISLKPKPTQLAVALIQLQEQANC